MNLRCGDAKAKGAWSRMDPDTGQDDEERSQFDYSMGCGSSSNKLDVVSSSDNGVTSTPPTFPRRSPASSATTRSADPDPEPETEPETERKSAPKRLPPMTFEVPIERGNSGSNGSAKEKSDSGNIVRQYPPRRLVRLEEQQVPLTHQLLDDRLAEADLRRQKILNQRIQSAHIKKHRRKPVSMETEWKVSGSENGENPNDSNAPIVT